MLRVGTDATYAPNQYAGPDGQPVGWKVGSSRRSARSADLDVEWSKEGFDQIVQKVTRRHARHGLVELLRHRRAPEVG